MSDPQRRATARPAFRLPRPGRSRRLLADRSLLRSLVSVSRLVGTTVSNAAGLAVGRVSDVVVEWSDESDYPPIKGIVVKVGRRTTFVHAAQLGRVDHHGIVLGSAKVALEDFERRAGEVLLVADVLDHQLVDIDGVRVVRAADLYLIDFDGSLRLVGVDVGMRRLLRRMTPGGRRNPVVPDRVVDWAAIQPFGGSDEALRLRRSTERLEVLRPAEVADLLEQLGRSERHELLSAFDPDAAADVLEEMEPEDVGALLRDASPERAAALLLGMAPDEAVDALRELDPQTRVELLADLPPEEGERLTRLLEYPGDTAGGVMTTRLITVGQHDTVARVRRELAQHVGDRAEIDGVIVVDADGVMYDDVTTFELLIAEPEQPIIELCGPPWPASIASDAPLDEVVEVFIDNRGSSLVVVDESGHPLGRILADDLVDALGPRSRARRWSL